MKIWMLYLVAMIISVIIALREFLCRGIGYSVGVCLISIIGCSVLAYRTRKD